MANAATMILAEKVASTGLADAPAEVRRVARDIFFDTVSCILAGTAEPGGAKMRRFVMKSGGGSGPASLLGTPYRAPAFLAALANGTCAAILDYDDNTWRLPGHPSGVIVPAVIALAEELDASGEAALEAFMVGHETMAKLAAAVNAPALYVRGFHTTNTVGIFGVVAACAKLLKLDALRIANAFGIAAAQAGSLRPGMGTMTLGLHSGGGAADGLMSACLAADGFTGQPTIFEMRHGFVEAFLGNDSHALDDICSDWCAPWDFVHPVEGAGIKLIPSATTSHCCGQIACELHHTPGFDPHQIERIQWLASPLGVTIARFALPDSHYESLFCTPWAIAAGLVDGKLGIAQFSDERLKDSFTRELARKVQIDVHPELRNTTNRALTTGGELTVWFKDGSVFKKTQWFPRAYPGGEPWTDEHLVSKYFECAAYAMSDEQARAALPIIREVDRLASIRELTECLRTQ
ncbi:MAG: MmgE/PrpD family protein [Burkholderiaceae bacterium]